MIELREWWMQHRRARSLRPSQRRESHAALILAARALARAERLDPDHADPEWDEPLRIDHSRTTPRALIGPTKRFYADQGVWPPPDTRVRVPLGRQRTIEAEPYLSTSYGSHAGEFVLWTWMPPQTTPRDLGTAFHAARWSPALQER